MEFIKSLYFVCLLTKRNSITQMNLPISWFTKINSVHLSHSFIVLCWNTDYILYCCAPNHSMLANWILTDWYGCILCSGYISVIHFFFLLFMVLDFQTFKIFILPFILFPTNKWWIKLKQQTIHINLRVNVIQ